MTKIASWKAIEEKVLQKFVAPGENSKCPSKADIITIDTDGLLEIAGTYSNNQLVKLDDITKVESVWEYEFSYSEAVLFGYTLNASLSIEPISRKRQYINGVPTGDWVSVSYNRMFSNQSSSAGLYFASTYSSNYVTLQSNNTGAVISEHVVFTQYESDKMLDIIFNQNYRGSTGVTKVNVSADIINNSTQRLYYRIIDEFKSTALVSNYIEAHGTGNELIAFDAPNGLPLGYNVELWTVGSFELLVTVNGVQHVVKTEAYKTILTFSATTFFESLNIEAVNNFG